MKNKTIIIFGASGGIGSSLKKILGHQNNIISVSSSEVDFKSSESFQLIFNLIKKKNPDIIFNCSGLLGNNYSDFNDIFNVNLRSNWYIIKSFFDILPSKSVKIILIGSSSYNRGKKDYMLYSSSKSALYNLYEGAKDFFENSNIKIGLVNPSRVNTKMISHLEKNPNLFYFEPEDLSKKIISFTENLKNSTYINFNNNK